MESMELVEISPIKELVSGHTVKVQVQLDENATDQQILSSLDDACKEWSNVQRVEMSLRLLVGYILSAVRKREIYKQDQWGTFEVFLGDVERRYGIKRSSAWDSLTIVEAMPNITLEQAKKIGPTNLLLAARAIKTAPEPQRKRLARQLQKEASLRPPVDEFRQRLQKANLLRTGTGRTRGMARITLDVPVAVAEQWRKLVGRQNGTKVFADLVHIALAAERPAGRHSRAGA